MLTGLAWSPLRCRCADLDKTGPGGEGRVGLRGQGVAEAANANGLADLAPQEDH